MYLALGVTINFYPQYYALDNALHVCITPY